MTTGTAPPSDKHLPPNQCRCMFEFALNKRWQRVEKSYKIQKITDLSKPLVIVASLQEPRSPDSCSPGSQERHLIHE